MDLTFLLDNDNEVRKIQIKKNGTKISTVSNEYNNDFQTTFHGILNGMRLP